MSSRRRFLGASVACAASAAAGFASCALAQVIGKTARIVVGFPPGGPTDLVARLIADKIRGGYAATVIVDNKPGAGGRIAVEHVKSSVSDGSVMLITPASMMVLYPYVYKKLAYDALRDFTPVTTVCSFPFALSVGPAVPGSVNTVADFVQWCRANPKQASYGSVVGSMLHFTGVMLGRAAGIELTSVPYKGTAPAIQDLLGGQIPATITPLAVALPHAKSGKLRVLATTGAERSPALPAAPTLKEAGYDLEAQEWTGIFVPAKTPPETVAQLNASIRDALKSNEVVEGLAKIGYAPVGESPAGFARIVKAEYDRWGPIVKASGFSPED